MTHVASHRLTPPVPHHFPFAVSPYKARSSLCPNSCPFLVLIYWARVHVRANRSPLGDWAQASLAGCGICRTGESRLGTLWPHAFCSRTVLHSHHLPEWVSFRDNVWHWHFWNLWSSKPLPQQEKWKSISLFVLLTGVCAVMLCRLESPRRAVYVAGHRAFMEIRDLRPSLHPTAITLAVTVPWFCLIYLCSMLCNLIMSDFRFLGSCFPVKTANLLKVWAMF